MPVIVQMKMRHGRPERFIVELDDEQEVVLTPETVLKHGISPGREFSDRDFLHLLQEDNLRQAKDQALRYLSIRPHSRWELMRKLREKGFRQPVIDQALNDLEKLDLVNDARFTRLFVQNELTLRPASRTLLSRKLVSRGIPREIYEPLLSELLPAETELKIARQLAEKFVRSNSRYRGKKLKEKLVRYLRGKGFYWEHIQQVIHLVEDK